MFDEVDKTWRQIMEIASEEMLIYENMEWEKVKADFENCNKKLDEIQKSLSDYLETKRNDFPRFFFLADDELLEILSKTKDPTLVCRYMNKCFEAIETITFSENLEVTTMVSGEKEHIDFLKPINPNEGTKKGNVEKWLSELEDQMK